MAIRSKMFGDVGPVSIVFTDPIPTDGPIIVPYGDPTKAYPGENVLIPRSTPIIPHPLPVNTATDIHATIKAFYTANPMLSLGIAAAAVYFLFIKK